MERADLDFLLLHNVNITVPMDRASTARVAILGTTPNSDVAAVMDFLRKEWTLNKLYDGLSQPWGFWNRAAESEGTTRLQDSLGRQANLQYAFPNDRPTAVVIMLHGAQSNGAAMLRFLGDDATDRGMGRCDNG